MRYRILGRTGLKCSEIGLGTWAFNASVYGPVEERQALETIGSALDRGISFFDTAPLYGDREEDGIAERILGKGLKGRRDKVVVASKFGRKSTEPKGPNFNAASAGQSVEESLQRLGTDYLDVLFFHSPFGPDEIDDDVWAGLERLKEQGKIRFVGHSISMFGKTQAMARRWATESCIDAIQVVYSLLNREAQELIRDLALQGIGVVARESLANGFLSGRVRPDTVFPPGSLNARYSPAEVAARVEQVEKLQFLLEGPIRSMPQAALRWVLSNEQVSLVLTGAKTSGEVEECAAAGETPNYSQATMARAAAVHQTDFAAA